VPFHAPQIPHGPAWDQMWATLVTNCLNHGITTSSTDL